MKAMLLIVGCALVAGCVLPSGPEGADGGMGQSILIAGQVCAGEGAPQGPAVCNTGLQCVAAGTPPPGAALPPNLGTLPTPDKIVKSSYCVALTDSDTCATPTTNGVWARCKAGTMCAMHPMFQLADTNPSVYSLGTVTTSDGGTAPLGYQAACIMPAMTGQECSMPGYGQTIPLTGVTIDVDGGTTPPGIPCYPGLMCVGSGAVGTCN